MSNRVREKWGWSAPLNFAVPFELNRAYTAGWYDPPPPSPPNVYEAEKLRLGVDSYLNPYATRIRTFYEWFDDDTVEGRPSRNHWNDAQHYVRRVIPASRAMDVPATQYRASGNQYVIYWHTLFPTAVVPYPSVYGSWEAPTIAGLPTLSVEDANGRGITTEYDPSSLIAAAQEQMLPAVKPKILSLAELYQTKDLIPSCLRTQDRWKKIERVLEPLLAVASRVGPLKRIFRVGRRLLALPADLYLQWKFNVQPTISDVAAIHAALSQVHSQVALLLKNAGRPQRKHYSCNVGREYPDVYSVTPTSNHAYSYPMYKSTSTEGFYPLIDCVVNKGWVQCDYQLTTFRAEVEFAYWYSEIERKQLELNVLLDSLGVGSNPLKELWEIIPWSFAVDWVVDVSRWLDNFANEPRSKPKIVINKWCWSHHIKRSTLVGASVRTSWEGPWLKKDSSIPIGTIYEDAYLRSTSGLTGWLGLSGRGFTSTEVVLASSLALTRQK